MTQAWPLPLWLAHRGAGKLAPENTLAAFRLGAAYGYRSFECDVKLSADEVPFLLHDPGLERTTNGQGLAGAQAWSALSQLDAGGWHSRTYLSEPLPTLAAIAAFIIGNGYSIDIELKPSPGTEQRTGQVVAQLVRALWQGQAKLPVFSSFQAAALRGALQAAPEIPRALLLDRLTPGWPRLLDELQCSALITQHRLMDAALVQALHAQGLKALVYTVNERPDARRLLDIGVDGLITDAVDRFAPASAALASG